MGKQANKTESSSRFTLWSTAVLLTAFVAACSGGGGGGGAPAAGGGGSCPATAIPGASGTPCANLTDPTVQYVSPSHLATNVPTSNGPGSTVVTATFSVPMDPTTIVSPLVPETFTLKVTGGADVPGTVTMNGANTIATFTPTAVTLLANTNYTATVTTVAMSAGIGSTAMARTVAWTFTTATVAFSGQPSPNLGTASTYGIFASSAAVTLAVGAVVNGDVGLNPADACNNCVVGTTVIGGVIHNGDAAAIQAQSDFNDAYIEASTRATNACAVTGDLSTAQGACAGVGFVPATPGPIYGPGLYRTATALTPSGTITLDAANNPDAVFIFQTDTALTTATSSVVLLANMAQAKNVWWIVGSAATLGVSSTFNGTVLANSAAVTVLNGTGPAPTTVTGRLFSRGAAADVNEFATVTVPAP